MSAPTQEERDLAAAIFRRQVTGSWTDHLAQALADHRERVLRDAAATTSGDAKPGGAA